MFGPAALAELAAEITAMAQRQEDRYCPSQFFHMQRLLQRAEHAPSNVQKLLAKRINALLSEYRSHLIQATRTADAAESSSENTSADLTIPLSLNQLKAQTRQTKALQRRQVIQQKSRALLNQLRSELAAPSLEELPEDSAQALDDEMRAMETAAQSNQLELAIHPTSVQRKELKAVRRYRQIAAQQKTEAMVNRAVIARPDNPGPLNPHMLAIKSLTSMRDLSLPYLNRFVSYIETIMWLDEERNAEQSGSDTPQKPDSKKKTPRKKR